MSPELREALLEMARTRRAYHATYVTEEAAGTLKGPDGQLIGETLRTCLAYGHAEERVKELAEAMLVEVEAAENAAGIVAGAA